MQIEGKIIAVLQERTGQNSRGAWKAQEYILETLGQYPKKVAFTVFGAERIDRFNIRVGQEVTAMIDIDAREYNGRWFNSIRAYDVRVINNPTAPAQPQQNPNVVYAKNVAEEQPSDDLPF